MGVDNTVSISYGIDLDEYLPEFMGNFTCIEEYVITNTDPSLLGMFEDDYDKLTQEQRDERYNRRKKIIDAIPVEIHDYWTDDCRYHTLILKDFHPIYSDGFGEININELTPTRDKVEAAEKWCEARGFDFNKAVLFASALYS